MRPPELAMTIFWPDAGKKPVLRTFGENFGLKASARAFRLSRTTEGLRGFAILILRTFAEKKRGGSIYALTGSLAYPLWDAQRHATDQKGDATWPNSIFGMEPPHRCPFFLGVKKNLRFQADDFPEGGFRVFTHEAAASIQMVSARALHGKPAEGEEISDLDAFADALATGIDLACSVLVSKNGSDTWIDVDEDSRDALPLQENDRFKLEIRSDPPSHVYVAILDSEGEVTPLFPWLTTDRPKPLWGSDEASLRCRDIARSRLNLPDDCIHLLPDAARSFSIGGAGGAETLLILARREGASLEALQDALARFWRKGETPIESVTARAAVRFDVWPPRRKPVFLGFRTLPAKKSKLGEALRKLQELLAETRPVDRAIMLSLPSNAANDE
jgi:hypothetical protein